MTSHQWTGAHNMFSTIATPSNYLQMLASQNLGSPHLLVGGGSHYSAPVLKPSIKHCLAHFIAACWAFTTNIPDCCKSFHVRPDEFRQSVKFSSLSRQFACNHISQVLCLLILEEKKKRKKLLANMIFISVWAVGINECINKSSHWSCWNRRSDSLLYKCFKRTAINP